MEERKGAEHIEILLDDSAFARNSTSLSLITAVVNLWDMKHYLEEFKPRSS